MTLVLSSAARETTGARSGQEDAFRLWPAEGTVSAKGEGTGLLAVLADGMGGHTGGAVAGQTACQTFREVFAATSAPFDTRLKTALQASNDALAKGVEQNAALRGMGCTLVAAWIDDVGLRWTSVGDSLLLLYRLPDVIRLNADHSLGSFLDEQARQNRISRSEARRNRNRNALRSALTGSKIDLIDLRSEPLELRPGDWIVLASDGICTLAGDEIADVVYRLRQSTPEEMADALIAAVKQKGAVDQDNTTVVAVRVDEAKAASDDVTTRVVMRPPKGDDADLRTRRIGVSRPLRHTSKSRKAAVWLATAAVLLISAAAVMIALPRQTSSPSPEGASAPHSHTTAPAKTIETAPAPGSPTPIRAPVDQAPRAPPSGPVTPAPQERPGSEGEEGASPRETAPRAVAPRPAAPTGPARSGPDSEEGGTSRSIRAPTMPAMPPKGAGEGEEGTVPRPRPPKASAVSRPPSPEDQPAPPARDGDEIAPRPSPSKPPAAARLAPAPAARPTTEGETGGPAAPRATTPKTDPNAPPKPRSGAVNKPSGGQPAPPAKASTAAAPAKPAPGGENPAPAPSLPPDNTPWRANALSGAN